jgi:hypothetical protein
MGSYRWRAGLPIVVLVLVSRAAFAQPGTDPLVAEARRHFELGVAHFDREEWQASLVEFLQSRTILPTKANTKNAAICLRKVGRFDESLDMFERLVRDFPDLSTEERSLVEREIAELHASVGTVQVDDAPPGADVAIDGFDRGMTPLAGPIRLAAGIHTVRVTKDGSLPFETRIDLAGKQSVVIHARLAPLTRVGLLRVTESSGTPLNVLVDGAEVGATPWEGALAPGIHVVEARGDGELGAAPARVRIELGEVARLELRAVPLRAVLRVDTQPKSAEISIDGVPVGHGSWQGRLEAGSHRVATVLAGYQFLQRTLNLGESSSQSMSVVLEPLEAPSRLTAEVGAGVPIGFLWGGDVADGCRGSCSAGVAMGWHGRVDLVYELPSGFGMGICAGYLLLSKSVQTRAADFIPVRRSDAADSGHVDDMLRLRGLTVAAEAQYSFGEKWRFTLRAGVGALIGSAEDRRKGDFIASQDIGECGSAGSGCLQSGSGYSVSATQSSNAVYLYFAPELRVARRLRDGLSVEAGVNVMAMAAVVLPAWRRDNLVAAGSAGAGRFLNGSTESFAGSLMIAAVPTVGIKYAF